MSTRETRSEIRGLYSIKLLDTRQAVCGRESAFWKPPPWTSFPPSPECGRSGRSAVIPRFWKDGWGDRTGLRLLHFHPSMGSSLRSPTLVHCTPKDGNGDVCQWVTLGLQSQTAALPGLSDRTVHSAQCQPGKKQPDSPSFQEMG